MSTKNANEIRDRIVAAIRDYTSEHNRAPTVREIQQAVGLSSPGYTQYHLDRLKEQHQIIQPSGVARGIEIVGDALQRRGESLVRLQIKGTIAAGEPIHAVETPEDLCMTRDMARDGDYVLRVQGNSMIDDRIEDGDLVVVRQQSSADNGDTVVALLLRSPDDVDGEATLKRLYREPPRSPGEAGRIRLQPRNSVMQPIYVEPDKVRIRGKVVAVIRNM